MEKFLRVILWILTDLFLVLSIALFPSLFSVFGILAAIIFIPIDEWQDIIKAHIKKPIKSAIIAVIIAFVIALFPVSKAIAGFNNLIASPAPSENSSIVYKEDSTPQSSDYFDINSNPSSNVSDISFEDEVTSIETNATNTTNNTSYKPSTTISKATNTNNFSKNNQTTSNETNGNTVYRTPSGKKYHFSSTCGGKNSYEVSYDDAINSKLTPCKKCAK